MNYRRSGEVMEAHAERWEHVTRAAHGRQPAIRSPSPVTDDRIDETGNADTIQKIADESGPADHCARSDGRAGIGKGKLEDPYGQEGHARGFIRRGRILQKEPVIADESVAVSKHERKPNGVKEDAA